MHPNWRRIDDRKAKAVIDAFESQGARHVSVLRSRDRTQHAIMAHEPIGPAAEPEDRRWHISLALEDRVPSWEELRDAAHQLRPGVYFAIAVPPEDRWLNVHSNVLHLWEIKDQPLIDQWNYEGSLRRDTPS
jgi:hypothetical protein